MAFNFDYSPLKTLAKALVHTLLTAGSLVAIQLINQFLSHPVDLPLGKVTIPAAVLVGVLVAVKNIIKQARG